MRVFDNSQTRVLLPYKEENERTNKQTNRAWAWARAYWCSKRFSLSLSLFYNEAKNKWHPFFDNDFSVENSFLSDIDNFRHTHMLGRWYRQGNKWARRTGNGEGVWVRGLERICHLPNNGHKNVCINIKMISLSATHTNAHTPALLIILQMFYLFVLPEVFFFLWKWPKFSLFTHSLARSLAWSLSFPSPVHQYARNENTFVNASSSSSKLNLITSYWYLLTYVITSFSLFFCWVLLSATSTSAFFFSV